MKNGIWVIGDVHGEYDKLIRLLEKLPKDAKICFVGDLIDRGKDSAKVVELVIKNGYFCVLGNHELMMIKACKNDSEAELWQQSVGVETFESYAEFDDKVLEAHVEYFKSLPYFLHFEMPKENITKQQSCSLLPESIILNIKPLVVSHSYIHHVWANKEHRYSENDAEDILWRHMHDKKLFKENREIENGVFNIFGHSVVYETVVTDTYAMIDTGACYESNKQLGYLSAIHYPSLEIIQVF